MKNKYSKFESNEFNNIVSKANDLFGLPEILPEMALYAINSNEKEREIHIYLSPIGCHFRLYSKGGELIEDRTDYVNLENKNIKGFLRFIAKIDFNSCNIGEILKFNYFDGKNLALSISTNTLIGNLITYYNYNNKIESFVDSLKLEVFTREKISEMTKKLDLDSEVIADKLDCINGKITSFANKCGIDINNINSSIKAKVDSISNDYSLYEKSYHNLIGKELLSFESIENNNFFAPVSIIIPSYNSERTIIQTLLSIESQNLDESHFSNIEVIVVDDGSSIPAAEVVAKYHFKFELKVVSLNKNQGLSVARNTGVSLSKNNILIFLDSDIVLSKNYILEHSVRNQIIPNSIFLSLKRNIDEDKAEISTDIIKKGVRVPDFFDDSRVKKTIKQDQMGIYKQSEDQLVEILQETNYFRDFGYGRKIGFYDLPTMVVGHNMSMRRSTFDNVGGFSQEFKGWGLEDTFFGAVAVSKGNYVIPVISTGVYHINHLPRSGSDDKKKEEFEKNIEKYKQIISRLHD